MSIFLYSKYEYIESKIKNGHFWKGLNLFEKEEIIKALIIGRICQGAESWMDGSKGKHAQSKAEGSIPPLLLHPH